MLQRMGNSRYLGIIRQLHYIWRKREVSLLLLPSLSLSFPPFLFSFLLFSHFSFFPFLLSSFYPSFHQLHAWYCGWVRDTWWNVLPLRCSEISSGEKQLEHYSTRWQKLYSGTSTGFKEHKQRCADKCLTAGALGWEETWICSICRFPPCKYSHLGRFQATHLLLLHMELGTGEHTLFSSRSWLSTSQRMAPHLVHAGVGFVMSGEVSQKRRELTCISFFGNVECGKRKELQLVFSWCTLKKRENAGKPKEEHQTRL